MPADLLLEIAKLPTAENSAIHLHATDNVAIARVPLSAGTELKVDGRTAHRARADSRRPQDRAGRDSRRAPWCGATARSSGAPRRRSNPAVTCTRTTWPSRSCTSITNSPRANCRCPRARPCPTFLGYPREDGSVGTRNYIAVVAASNCAAHTAELIAHSFDGETLPANVDGVVAFPARRRLRPHHRPGYRAASPHAGRRVGASQRLGGGDSGPGLRGEPDRALSWSQRSAQQPPGRDDAAIERRHARGSGGGARGDRAADGAVRGRTARGDAGFAHRAGAELRRLGFVLRHHGESGAGRLFGYAGRDRRVRRCWRRPPKSSAPSICWCAARATGRWPRSC